MAEGTGLPRRAAEQAIRDLLTAKDSEAVEALTKELADTGLAQMNAEEVSEMLSDLLG
jgi:hypothetical protein